jgi:hypothetical protein
MSFYSKPVAMIKLLATFEKVAVPCIAHYGFFVSVILHVALDNLVVIYDGVTHCTGMARGLRLKVFFARLQSRSALIAPRYEYEMDQPC